MRLAEAFAHQFAGSYNVGNRGETQYVLRSDAFYDWLYERDYDPWFCNLVKKIDKYDQRALKEFIMRIQTGEVITPLVSWSPSDVQELSQSLLRSLAEDSLNGTRATKYQKGWQPEKMTALEDSLALDGYILLSGHLLVPEAEVLDVQELTGVLESLYISLNLGGPDLALHHLSLSEEHYISHRWDDSISNSRKFLEAVLKECSRALSAVLSPSVATLKFDKPVEVREFLEKRGLLDKKEREALDKIYGLLSHTGGHPYMAQEDQARLLRHLALTFAHFVMLRLQGYLASKP